MDKGSESVVYFMPSRVGKYKESLPGRLGMLIERAGLGFIKEKSLVAVKVHFGELGNTAALRPIFAAKVVEMVRERGGKPFLTDSNCLYIGARSNAVDHLECAVKHGFTFATVGAPLIIMDGLTSRDSVEIRAGGKHFETVKIGSAVYYADSLVCVSRFKGHLATGFGGAIKNLGMGIGSRSTKQRMHGSVKPELKKGALCTACGTCLEVCDYGAIEIKDKACFDHKKCVGCAECIAACPEGVLKILWNEKPEILSEKMVDTSLGVMKNKKGKVLFINFLTDITPDCDCFFWSDNAIVPDIGILASSDPVAIDTASADLVNKAPASPDSVLPEGTGSGDDKFKAMHPEINWRAHLEYAEEAGLGTMSYRLEEI